MNLSQWMNLNVSWYIDWDSDNDIRESGKSYQFSYQRLEFKDVHVTIYHGHFHLCRAEYEL